MQAKRTIFPNKILPYMLLVPQLAVTLVFFIWPALQAVKSSFEREDPFGFSTTFVWFENYRRLFVDPNYIGSLGKTAVFAVSVTLLSMTLALILAVAVNRVLRTNRLYTPCWSGPMPWRRSWWVSCGGSCSTPPSASRPICCAALASTGTTGSTVPMP